MTQIEKFGLEELSKLAKEVSIGGNEVQTVKVVLAITGIPNTVVSEAKEVISSFGDKIKTLESDSANVRTADARDEDETHIAIEQAKSLRKLHRSTNSDELHMLRISRKTTVYDIARLEKILKKFA